MTTWLAILASVFTALVLAILPLPDAIAMGRPAFVALIVCFWILHAPNHFGFFMAWLSGLCLDGVSATMFGQHALALAVVAFAVIKLRNVLHQFPSWQQAVLLLPIFGLFELCLLLIDGWAGRNIDPWWRWTPVLTTTLIWPPIAGLLLLIRERARPV